MLSYPGFLPLAPFPVNSLLKFCHHQVTSLPEDPQVDFFFSKESLFGIQKPLGSDHKGTHLPSLLHSAMIYPYQTPTVLQISFPSSLTWLCTCCFLPGTSFVLFLVSIRPTPAGPLESLSSQPGFLCFLYADHDTKAPHRLSQHPLHHRPQSTRFVSCLPHTR